MSAQHQPQGSYGQQFAPSRPSASPAPALLRQSSYNSHTSTHHTPVPLTPQAVSHTPYNSHYSSTPVASTTALPHSSHTPNPLTAYDAYGRSTSTAAHRSSVPIGSSSSSNIYNPPRPVEVYHLSDSANASIPADIRAQFHRDEHDRVLFFTAPPMDVSPVQEKAKTLGHSVKYLAAKARERATAEAAKALKTESTSDAPKDSASKPRLKRKSAEEEKQEKAELIKRLKSRTIENLGKMMWADTEEVYRQIFGDAWKEELEAMQAKLAVMQTEQRAKNEMMEKNAREREEAKKITWRKQSLYP